MHPSHHDLPDVSRPTGQLLAGVVFIIASVTDLLDGYFARRYGAVTTLGKLLDPLADKLLVLLTMVMLIPLGRIPMWMVLVVLTRELAVTGLRGIAATEGIVVQASVLGKYKTIFQSVALSGLCLHHEYFYLNTHVVGMTFMWMALVITVWSGWDYFRKLKRLFQEKKTVIPVVCGIHRQFLKNRGMAVPPEIPESISKVLDVRRRGRDE